jgi:hypothetical protein
METFAPKGTVAGPILPEFVLQKTISLGAKIVYGLLCDYAAYDHFCFPSHKTLASRVACSVSSIKRYLKELVDAKLIAIRQERYTSSTYYLLRPAELASGTAKAVPLPKAPSQPNMDRPQCRLNCPQANVSYVTNLMNQEEKRNPPLPPTRAMPPSPLPIPRQKPVGGGDSFSPDFEKAWAAYPRKEAEGLARHAWRQLERNGLLPTLDVLLSAISRFAATEQWQRENGRFVPQMVNWLRGQRWKDPLPPAEEQSAKHRKTTEAQAPGEKERQAAAKAKSERLRELFRAFAVKFGPVDEHNDYACGLWRYLHAKGMPPTPDDVPDDNTLSLVDFLNEFKRKRQDEAWLAAHPRYEAAPAPLPSPDGPPKRENNPLACGDYLRATGLLDTILKRQEEAVCLAV